MLKKIGLLLLLFCVFGKLHSQELSIQTGHAATINDLAYSPDGKILASCGNDNVIILWDLISFKQMRIFSGHKGAVNAIAFHPTKKWIASTSDDKSIRLWEYPSGKLIKEYTFAENEVKSLAFSPNGKYLACGAKKVTVIDLEKNSKKTLPYQAKDIFNALSFSEDSKSLIFGGKKEKKCRVVNLQELNVVKVFKIKANDILIFDNQIYVAGNRGLIKRRNMQKKGKNSFTLYASFTWNSFYALALNSEYLFAANKDNLIYMYKRKNGKKIESLKAHMGEVKALAVSPDGKYLASSGKDRKIIIWEIEKRKIIKVLQGGARSVNSVSFSKDGNQMFIAYRDGSFKLWDLKSKGDLSFAKYEDKSTLNPAKRIEVSTSHSQGIVNASKFLVKVHKSKLDKFNDEVLSEKEKIAVWDLQNGSKIHWIANDKSSEYQAYALVDTTRMVSFTHKASHSQKYSLLNHKRIKEREEVFSTLVKLLKIKYPLPSKFRPKEFMVLSSFKIKGDVYFKKVSPDAKMLLVFKYLSRSTQAELYQMADGKLVHAKRFSQEPEQAEFSPSGKYFCISKGDRLYIYQSSDFQLLDSLNGTFPVCFRENDQDIAYTHSAHELILYDFISKERKYRIQTQHQTQLSDIKFNEKYNYIATAAYDGLIKFWKIGSGEGLVSLASFNTNDFIYVSPDNYYFSTKGSMNYIGFYYDQKLYSFEQFDLKYNRPDLVLAKLDYAEASELEAFKFAYLKRLKKMGIDAKSLNSDFHVPEAQISNSAMLPVSTPSKEIELALDISDEKYKLDRVNVWINNVSIYGTNGISLKELETQNASKNIKVELASGNNKIQCSCMNEKGVESFKETANIVCDAPAAKPTLYVVTMGVSEYKNSAFNLTYAAKDASDIAQTFKNKGVYKDVKVKVLTNSEVTKGNLANVRKFLEQAGRDDIVMLFIAGHGVLDAKLDYYFASHDMDFNNPSGKGIKYEEVEALLDGLKALKKIFFMDTCHSGEVDKDEMEVAAAENTTQQQGSITFRNVGTGVQRKAGSSSSSEMAKELFTDLRTGTGATVISSAGGGEYAMESDQWKNGLFTYCLLNGLNSKAADLNKDGEIMLSELQQYVQSQVSELSGGMQKPTSRIENIEMDFRVW